MKKLRARPNLDQLRRQAKELLDAFTAGEPGAVAEVNEHYRDANRTAFALHDAQLVLARSYGFDSWPKLKAYVDGVTVHRLAEAVRAGDIPQVRAMLKARPELVNMDMAENDEHHALHYAVFKRDPEMVRVLMHHGADARTGIYPHRNATTALTIATERGYGEIVAVIQEEERRRRAALSGPNAIATVEPDELMEAIVNGDDERALAMLESQSALTHACNRNGWTPLHAAAAMRNERLVEWLLQHGAEVNRRDPQSRTPLDHAARRPWRKTGSSEQFVGAANLLRQHGAELTARSAVAFNDADWLRARHAEGTLVNPIEDWGGLLTVAVLHDKPEILTLLLDFGFDPDERVRLAGVEEVFYSQAMPLWHCAAHGKLAMAEMLLQRGANPNVHVYASGTPVYSAYRQRDWTMVELLKRYGGVVDPITLSLFHEKELARQMLADEKQGRLPAGILEGKNVSEDLLRGAADSGDQEIVRTALEGVDWPRDDDRWYWILMQAIWAPSPECFRLILDRCDANLRHPRFGRTILHDVAALGGDKTAEKSPEFAAMLLDAGAKINERDDILKSTPLGWACRWGRIELVKLLLNRGADPVEADAEPWATPRAWAEKMGHGRVLAFLLGWLQR
ncbi:MAG TPA: ankyrin repeat domain-containing protein [Bryobacteraceae bacterium]